MTSFGRLDPRAIPHLLVFHGHLIINTVNVGDDEGSSGSPTSRATPGQSLLLHQGRKDLEGLSFWYVVQYNTIQYNNNTYVTKTQQRKVNGMECMPCSCCVLL